MSDSKANDKKYAIKPVERNYFQENRKYGMKLKRVDKYSHPLNSSSKINKINNDFINSDQKNDNITSNNIVNDNPLKSDPLSSETVELDPLTQIQVLNNPTYDPNDKRVTKEIKNLMSTMDDGETFHEDMRTFEAWKDKRVRILKKYTSNKRIGVQASFLDIKDDSEQQSEQDQLKKRVEELDVDAKNPENQTMMSQAEYIKRMVSQYIMICLCLYIYYDTIY